MKIFIALLFTLSLSSTFLVPAIALVLDDTQQLNIGSVIEEEETKSRGELKKIITTESCFLTFMGVKKKKVFSLNTTVIRNCIYMDVFVPPPEHKLAS